MLSWRRKSSNSSLEVLERRLALLTTGVTANESTSSNIGPLGLSLLHAPSTALIDFIFVHGLRGGSKKTWSKTNDPYHFWPKEWLSRDPDFKHVRIHSFGYDSDWGSGKNSILNVHDFGKALLAEIVNSPQINKDGNSAIVFIGHSMGGLVIKNACILASQDPLAQSVANRIHGIVFLATPHRGADLATLLKNIVRVSTLQKPFLADLERGSSTIKSINDDFRHHASAFDIRSFYETLRTSVGLSSFLVVDKESAILGYPNEQAALLNATHRGICKFDSPLDPNFISLRNALLSMTRDVVQKALLAFENRHRDELRKVQTYLGVSETPEDDLANLENAQLRGTCEWLTSRKEFLAWQDSSSSALPYYCLRASPAAGKSVMAAHVIRYLEDMNRPCSFFFFKHDDASKASLESCLTSIAYQMALVEPAILQRLLAMQAEGVRLDRDNPLNLWRKIFVNGILEIVLSRQHFWVIDALDECSNSISITSLFEKVSPTLAPRVFVTSRSTFETFKSFEALKDRAYLQQVTAVDTRGDVDLYVRLRTKDAVFENSSLRHHVTDTIIAKSCGSFLWAVLVVEEIRSAFSEADVWRILGDVPQGMNALYGRSLKLLSEGNRGKHIIKAILVWIVCAVRPLSLGELNHALSLDTGENILSLEEVLLARCGNLVQVDRNSRVSVVHETARAFLLQEHLDSEFAVNKTEGQRRIADVCLAYLNSEEFQPPRSPKLMHVYRAKAGKRSPFSAYACLHFGQHLRTSQPENFQRCSTLSTFFEANVYCWIEFVAQASAVHVLTQTAKDIKAFLQACTKYHPPVGKEVQRVEDWHQDLIRLATQFGQNLIDCPSSIFWLVPPLCPPRTAIGAQFGKANQGMTVSGLSTVRWSDRTASIHYNDRQARQLACADAYFAVALSDNSVQLYSRPTCQQVLQHDLGRSAKVMTFSGTERLLAICTVYFVMVYRVASAQVLWKTRLRSECLALSFSEDEEAIWLTTKGGAVYSFSVADGSRLSFARLDAPSDTETDLAFSTVFTCASISLDLNMIAAVRRGRPIGLYEMESGAFIGSCKTETDRDDGLEQHVHALSNVLDLVFSPSSSTSLLGALYHHGDLVSFDPCELRVVACVQANAHTLSCSPNGRLLATGDINGIIQVFEFDSLRLVYRVRGSDFLVKKIAFASNGLRFYDIRGSQCNVWDPPCLALNDGCETASVSDTVEPDAVAIPVHDVNGAQITAIACHPTGDFVFCGKDSGSVALYSTTTGKELQILYQHARNIRVRFVEYAGGLNTLVSVDAASRFIVSKVLGKGEAPTVETRVLDTRISNYSVNQILLSPDGKCLLVSTIASDNVYDLESGIHNTIPAKARASWKWINHPSGSDKLIHMTTKEAQIYTWGELLKPPAPGAVERPSSTELVSDMPSDMFLKGITVSADGSKLAIEFSTSHRQQPTSHVLFLSVAALLEPVPATVESLPQFTWLAARIEHVVGRLGRRLIFLDRKMWVCSVDLHDFKDEYSRHCFIPNDWLSANWDVKMEVSPRGDLIFVKVAELAVIKRGLDIKELLKV